jgi:hypothetical protein
MNPLGTIDLDQDGQAEVVSVTTPHLGGTLKVYQRRGNRLAEVARLDGFSNHIYGSSDLLLSAFQTVGSKVRVLVPDNSRRQLRIVEFTSGRLMEIGRCALPAPVTGAIKPLSDSEVSLSLATGNYLVVSNGCWASGKPAQ